MSDLDEELVALVQRRIELTLDDGARVTLSPAGRRELAQFLDGLTRREGAKAQAARRGSLDRTPAHVRPPRGTRRDALYRCGAGALTTQEG